MLIKKAVKEKILILSIVIKKATDRGKPMMNSEQKTQYLTSFHLLFGKGILSLQYQTFSWSFELQDLMCLSG